MIMVCIRGVAMVSGVGLLSIMQNGKKEAEKEEKETKLNSASWCSENLFLD